jgi:hypothetical protein
MNNKITKYTVLGIIVILIVVGLTVGFNEYGRYQWNTKNCYQFSVRDYWLDEVPLRCKWQQVIYKNNTEDMPNFDNPRVNP